MGDEAYRHIEVSSEEQGGILFVTLAGSKGNILTMVLMEELYAALAAHADDADLRLVVLRGKGGLFSYGASVEEHKAERAPDMLQAFHRLVRGVAAFPVPVAALVEGRCLGGAFEVVLACHFVFATADAVFACPEIKLGVFPPVLAAIGAQRLGGATMERLLLTGTELDAARAKELGWVTEILPTQGQNDGDTDPKTGLLDWYRAHLEPLSAFSIREATGVAREASGLLQALDMPLDIAEARYIERLLPSHDGNEGIQAFLERRRPKWRNA